MDSIAHIPAQLGTILKSRRQQRGETQKEAGAKAGLKQATVSAVEADASRASVETLFKLLSVLDLELVLRDRRGRSRAAKAEW